MRFVTTILLIVCALTVSASQASCDTFYDGEFCENPTTQQPDEMPINVGTLVYYTDAEGIPAFGFVIGYWWQFPSQTWDYQVMTKPPYLDIGYGASFDNVSPDQIYQTFEEVQLP